MGNTGSSGEKLPRGTVQLELLHTSDWSYTQIKLAEAIIQATKPDLRSY